MKKVKLKVVPHGQSANYWGIQYKVQHSVLFGLIKFYGFWHTLYELWATFGYETATKYHPILFRNFKGASDLAKELDYAQIQEMNEKRHAGYKRLEKEYYEELNRRLSQKFEIEK